MNRSNSTKSLLSDNKDSSQSFKGVRFFIELGKLIDGYYKVFQANEESQLKGINIPRKEQRIERIKTINNFVEQIQKRCSLEEQQKFDCLIQSLQIIKKISRNLNSKEHQTRSKRMSFAAQEKVIEQVKRKLIRNMGELILLKLTPAKKSQNAIIYFITTVIENLMEYHPIDQKEDLDKRKTKKMNLKSTKDKVNVQISLGQSKINLIWFLVFKVAQKYLQNFDNFCREDKNEGTYDSEGQVYEKHVNRYIKEIIRTVILDRFGEINLWKDLLKAITQNIDQIQLPIVPFFLKNAHSILEEKLKIYFKVCFDNDEPQKINPKEIFSLENIAILLELIPKYSQQMMKFQSSCIQAQVKGQCDYCGRKKIIGLERSIYQKIVFSYSEKTMLTVTFCDECCRSLQTSPRQKVNLIVFLPILLTWYSKEFERSKMQGSKISLKVLMTYHEENSGHKDHKRKKAQIEPKAALIESVSDDIIKKLYNRVLFQHSHLSIKNILNSLFQIMLIFWNFRDDKIREKSIKIMNKSHILNYVFSPTQTRQLKQEGKQIRDKMIKSLYNRLKDCSSGVSLASLEILTQIVTHGYMVRDKIEEFFQFVFKSVEQKIESSYISNFFDLLQKAIAKLQVLTENDVTLQVKILMKGLMLSMNALKVCGQQQKKDQCLSTSIAKFLNLLLTSTAILCENQKDQYALQKVDYEYQIQFQKNDCSFLKDYHEYPDNLVLFVFTSGQLNISLLKNMTFWSSKTIIDLVSVLEHSSCSEMISKTIQHNIGLIMDIIFQDVSSLSEQICFRKRRQSKLFRDKNNLESIIEYVNSSSFIQLLIKTPKESSQSLHIGSIRCKQQLLNKLLYFNNINHLLCKRKQIVRYMNIWQKSKRKSLSKTLDPIVVSSSLEVRLGELSEKILEETKLAGQEDIGLKCSLLVNLKSFLGQLDDLKGRIIFIYEKYCNKFYQEFSNQLLKEQTILNFEQILSHFLALSRCLHITSVIIVKLEEFMLFNKTIENFYEKQIAEMTQGNKQRIPFQLSHQNTDTFLSSQRFKKMYSLILTALVGCTSKIRENEQILEQYQKILLLLRYFWKVNPKSIFSDQKIFAILKQIDVNTERGFLLMKSIYKLFQSLLPSSNLQVLNFIREQFVKTFHSILKSPYRKENEELIESSFQIIYHLLKCGMEGLYQYNKYIFYGLLHSSSKVNQTSLKIIRQIYTKEGSEKILFINLMDSFQLINEIYFNNANREPFVEIKFNKQQQEAIGILTQITQKKALVYLPKDKKEIRIKSTFIKKVSDILGAEINLIKNKPIILCIILQFIKNQKILDFIELTEILFCLHKIYTMHQLLFENHLELINDYINFDKNLKDILQSTQIILTYRQLLSCITYYSKYQITVDQIKIYQENFQQNGSPYTELKQVILTTTFKPEQSSKSKLEKIEQDINTFQDIIEGDCQVGTSKEFEDYSLQNSGNSSMTILTKAKRNKKNDNRNFKKKRRNKHSESANKVTFNSSLEDPQIEKDNIKTRLRNKGLKPGHTKTYEC